MLPARCLVALTGKQFSYQAGRMEGRKSGWLSRAFSKRKEEELGIEVDMVTMRGIWSEVVRILGVRVVLRKASFMVRFMNTQSSRARVGEEGVIHG